MLSHQSSNGYSKIPTITIDENPIEFKQLENLKIDQLENLKYQVKPPKVDEYFKNDMPRDFTRCRHDFRETRKEGYKFVSTRSFSFWNKFKLKHFPYVRKIKPNKGLLYSNFWFCRYYLYDENNEEFFAYYLHPEDLNFDTDFYKKYRIKLTLIFENTKYITFNAFNFLTIGAVLDTFLKYPIWSNFYSFTVSDNLHQFDLIDFMLKIKYFVDHNILHDGSIILIEKLPDKKFIFF